MKAIAQVSEVVELLKASGLPTDDLQSSHALKLFGEDDFGGRLSGAVGYELYGPNALLRSLAVKPEMRGLGLGTRLVAFAESNAKQDGVQTIWLLTTNADKFFERHGYSHVERSRAPDSIATTAQFSSLCPVSSAFMCKRLGA